ncbi:MAG: Proton/glutamate-aspartate symporter [Verrucomicrobia subdivision 3 bacterium]|nr:Proton/glutamate-aspartate symporter [Limisphaerales bacterium]MCS1416869.1 Proton/glutamate-aspartate symporter [Limisphaerales bacterium]
MNLTVRILIGMVAGLLIGLVTQWLDLSETNFWKVYVMQGAIDAGGQIFIKSLKMMVVPLVLVSLICGAASLGASGSIGRLGGKTIGLYLVTTAIAVTLALSLALVVDPGIGAGDADNMSTEEFQAEEVPSVKDTLINIFPDNPIQAMADGRMLQVIVFALLFGLSLSRSEGIGQRVLRLFKDINEILMKLITMLIALAPYGVFCLMAKLGLIVGWSEITKLMTYFLTVTAVLLIHATVTYPTLLWFLARVNPITYLKKMREPMMVAFSTSSSGATMPVTLRTVENRLGVSNNVASFAVPLGATINMDGTAIMQGVATVFIAQFFGIQLGVNDYLMVILTATLASIGTAAVPGVGIIMLTMVLTQVGLPVEGIALILGVDRLLDMMRTAVNVAGDGMVATTVASSEGMLDRDIFSDPDAGRVIESRAPARKAETVG